VIKKQRFSFNRVKAGLYYMPSVNRVLEFQQDFKIKDDTLILRKVLNKMYLGKINEVV